MHIQRVIAEVPTYGYRRGWVLLRLESESEGLTPANAKKAYRVMRDNRLLLGRKPAQPVNKRAHKDKVVITVRNCGPLSR